MKVSLKLASVVILLLAVLTGGIGCDLFEDISCEGSNYINVAVSASIHAQVIKSDPVIVEPWSGALLEVEINKADGEKVFCTGLTNAYGDLPEQCQVTFKVYKDQFVQIIIRPQSGALPAAFSGETFDPVHDLWSGHVETLRWHELEDCGWGDTYFWSPTVTLSLEKY